MESLEAYRLKGRELQSLILGGSVSQQLIQADPAPGLFIHLFDDDRAVQTMAAVRRRQGARHDYRTRRHPAVSDFTR